MYIGIDIDVTDQVRLHNVIFSDDFIGNIEEIFEGRLSHDPSIYVYVPAVADKSLCTRRQNWYLCVNADSGT